jgi:hypothetical protein
MICAFFGSDESRRLVSVASRVSVIVCARTTSPMLPAATTVPPTCVAAEGPRLKRSL